jgi:hypothetical protein
MSMDWFGGKIFTGNHGFYDQKKRISKRGVRKVEIPGKNQTLDWRWF